MQNDLREKNNRGFRNMRSLLDFTMGLLYISAAAFLFFSDRFGIELENFDKRFGYVFGGLCAIYGVWRIYRGYKKEYY